MKRDNAKSRSASKVSEALLSRTTRAIFLAAQCRPDRRSARGPTRKRTSSPRPSPPASLGGEGVTNAPELGSFPPREETSGERDGERVLCFSVVFLRLAA